MSYNASNVLQRHFRITLKRHFRITLKRHRGPGRHTLIQWENTRVPVFSK